MSPIDLTGPKLVSLSLSVTSVNTGSSSQEITVTARIINNLSGLQYGWLSFQSPSGNQYVGATFYDSYRKSGTAVDGVYEYTMTLPAFSEKGVWTVTYFDMEDGSSNRTELTGLHLSAAGFPTSFTVSGGLIEAVDATAALTGLDYGELLIWTPSGYEYVHVSFTDYHELPGASSEAMDEAVLAFPDDFDGGSWHSSSFEIGDNALIRVQTARVRQNGAGFQNGFSGMNLQTPIVSRISSDDAMGVACETGTVIKLKEIILSGPGFAALSIASANALPVDGFTMSSPLHAVNSGALITLDPDLGQDSAAAPSAPFDKKAIGDEGGIAFGKQLSVSGKVIAIRSASDLDPVDQNDLMADERHVSDSMVHDASKGADDDSGGDLPGGGDVSGGSDVPGDGDAPGNGAENERSPESPIDRNLDDQVYGVLGDFDSFYDGQMTVGIHKSSPWASAEDFHLVFSFSRSAGADWHETAGPVPGDPSEDPDDVFGSSDGGSGGDPNGEIPDAGALSLGTLTFGDPADPGTLKLYLVYGQPENPALPVYELGQPSQPLASGSFYGSEIAFGLDAGSGGGQTSFFQFPLSDVNDDGIINADDALTSLVQATLDGSAVQGISLLMPEDPGHDPWASFSFNVELEEDVHLVGIVSGGAEWSFTL